MGRHFMHALAYLHAICRHRLLLSIVSCCEERELPGFIPVIEIPAAPNHLFLREWSWLIVKGRHPFFFFLHGP